MSSASHSGGGGGYFAAPGSTTIAPSLLHSSPPQQLQPMRTFDEEEVEQQQQQEDRNGTTMQFANKRRRLIQQKHGCRIVADEAIKCFEESLKPLLEEAVEIHRKCELMLKSWYASERDELMWEEMRLGLKFFHDMENRLEEFSFSNATLKIQTCVDMYSKINPQDIEVPTPEEAEKDIPAPPPKKKPPPPKKRTLNGSLAKTN